MNKYIDKFVSNIQVLKLSTQWIHESMVFFVSFIRKMFYSQLNTYYFLAGC